jgi:hypothetical protein
MWLRQSWHQRGVMVDQEIPVLLKDLIDFLWRGFIGPTMRYRSWVEFPYISDHAPIILQLDIGLSATAHPFKFNPVWLRDDSFATLASEVWNDVQFQLVEGAQRRLVEKLSLLKKSSKIMVERKKYSGTGIFKKLEVDLEMLYVQKFKGSLTDDLDHRLMFLEAERNKFYWQKKNDGGKRVGLSGLRVETIIQKKFTDLRATGGTKNTSGT